MKTSQFYWILLKVRTTRNFKTSWSVLMMKINEHVFNKLDIFSKWSWGKQHYWIEHKITGSKQKGCCALEDEGAKDFHYHSVSFLVFPVKSYSYLSLPSTHLLFWDPPFHYQVHVSQLELSRTKWRSVKLISQGWKIYINRNFLKNYNLWLISNYLSVK